MRAIEEDLGDFAVGEIPLVKMSRQESQRKFVQVPIAVLGIVPIYNLPGKPRLRFSGDLLAQICMGRVTSWNDRRIAELNPGVALPHMPIVVVQRPENSGTRYIFTDFLSQSSAGFRDWHAKHIGLNHEERETVPKSRQMIEGVKLHPGAIGYVEWSLAVGSGLAYGSVQNRSGKFVDASESTIAAACKTHGKSPENFPVSLVNAESVDSYPVSSFVWAYIPVSGLDPKRAAALRQFLIWAVSEGQGYLKALPYSPLPSEVAERARLAIQLALP